ncbi:hypothetical protein [Streptococcus uberis]|uniref:hypothetical protein n=1 Tax=Streptococcus uberis TaxID=1349 RepID=UPI0021F20355|nr:hypothetical protein [Streptococcus uberis]MCV6816699.1 hypothetical protein [Streptococcus uberis]MCZ8476900.1 hypothetical protein [Streptococcus uberis]
MFLIEIIKIGLLDVYIECKKRYNIADKFSELIKGEKMMAERFFDVLAMVWIGIAGTDSRWV